MEGFGSKEEYLDGLRRKRGQTDGGAANSGQDVRSTISSYASSNGGRQSEGGEGASGGYGRAGSHAYTEGSAAGIAEQLESIHREPPGSDSSADQYVGGPASSPRKSRWQSVKDVAGKYKEAVKREPKTRDDIPKVARKRLTDAEAIKLRPKLVMYILWQSEHMDNFIIATTGGHDHSIEIWGDIDKDEAEIIADFLIDRGKRDAKTAQAVRMASVVIDRIKIGIIIGPRVYKTMMIYWERGFTLR